MFPPLIIIVEIIQKQRKYNVEVEYQSKLSELTKELREALECENDEECLLFKNTKELDLNQTFQQQQIQKGETIQVQIKKKSIQQINQSQQNENQQKETLKTIPFQSIVIKARYQSTAQIYNFEINNTNLVSDLMSRIHMHMNLKKESNIQLFLNSQLLKPERTLRNQQVQNNSLIDIYIQQEAGSI